MIYVIRVFTGKEQKTKKMIEHVVSPEAVSELFLPIRVRQKKYKGAWHEVRESLVPGYLFAETDDPERLYSELKNVLALTKILGFEDPEVIPLPEKDVAWLRQVLGLPEEAGEGAESDCIKSRGKAAGKPGSVFAEREAGLTLVDVKGKDEITILEGPLKGMEGKIRKFDLHKRQAEVEIDFMGNKTRIFLGIRFKNE